MTVSVPESQRLGHLVTVSPAEVAGEAAPFHCTDQTNARTRFETPTGAQSIAIFNDCEVAIRVVFNIAGTTEADSALGEAPAVGGGTISGVSYVRIPAGKFRVFGFPDPQDRLYYTDWLAESSISPGGVVWGHAIV
jgi:hypothetical protein